jgi:hypothetical protein
VAVMPVLSDRASNFVSLSAAAAALVRCCYLSNGERWLFTSAGIPRSGPCGGHTLPPRLEGASKPFGWREVPHSNLHYPTKGEGPPIPTSRKVGIRGNWLPIRA